jgi:hypothetical protein
MSNSTGLHDLLRGGIRSLVVLLLASGAAHAAIPASERQALLDLYTSTKGAGWTTSTGWNDAPGTECFWYHVTCNGNSGAQTTVTMIDLRSNHLVGPLPATIGNLGNLTVLTLDHNQLSGPIPSLAANTPLQLLSLSSNQLTGPVDSSLGTLMNLVAGGLDLRWNALSSTNPTLTAFLNSKQDGGDRQSTQTIPVTGLGASGITGTQVTVKWMPIAYTGDTGNYQVLTPTSSGGPYSPFAAATPNKSATSLTVTGLAPGRPYFFTAQTTTAPPPARRRCWHSQVFFQPSAPSGSRERRRRAPGPGRPVPGMT